MGVLDDPFGLGSGLNFGIPDGFGFDGAAQTRDNTPRPGNVKRYGIYYVQNGLRRSKRFRTLTEATRFKLNAKNLEGVTAVSDVFEL